MRNKREERTDSFRKRFVAAGGTRILAKIIAVSGATLGLHMSVAETMLALTIAKENRGRMVQDGALKCLLSVGKDLDKVSNHKLVHERYSYRYDKAMRTFPRFW